MKIGTLLAAVAGGIVLFLLGFLFFGVLFFDFFNSNMVQYPGLQKDPPIWWALIAFNIVWAWLIAWVVERSGGTGWAIGAKVGAIVMFVIALGLDLEFHAFMNVHKELAPMLAHMLILAVMGLISGAVIGLVLGYFGREPAAA